MSGLILVIWLTSLVVCAYRPLAIRVYCWTQVRVASAVAIIRRWI